MASYEMKIIKHGCSIGVCFKSKCGDLLVFHSHDSYDAAAQRRLAWVGQGLQEFCRDSRRLLTDHQQSRQIECSKISHGSKFFERIRRYYKDSRRYSDSTFDAPIGCSNMEPLDNLAFQVQEHTAIQQHPYRSFRRFGCFRSNLGEGTIRDPPLLTMPVRLIFQ